MTPHRSRILLLLSYLVLTIGAFVALTVDEGIAAGLIGAAGVLIGVAITEIGRRRKTGWGSVLTGFGDERERGLYREAGFRTSEILEFVLVGWALVSIGMGQPNDTIIALCLVYAVVWALNLAWVVWSARRARHSAIG